MNNPAKGVMVDKIKLRDFLSEVETMRVIRRAARLTLKKERAGSQKVPAHKIQGDR
jgi:hypothetical protein